MLRWEYTKMNSLLRSPRQGLVRGSQQLGGEQMTVRYRTSVREGRLNCQQRIQSRKRSRAGIWNRILGRQILDAG